MDVGTILADVEYALWGNVDVASADILSPNMLIVKDYDGNEFVLTVEER